MKHREKLLDWFTRRSTITPMEAWAASNDRSLSDDLDGDQVPF